MESGHRATKRQRMESGQRSLFVAGGTDGIGFSFVANECQRRKYARIYVLGRNFARIDTELMSQHAERLVKLECDITNASALRESLAGIEHTIDDFVNTIGTFARGAVSEMQDAEITQHFGINCIGNINLIRAMLPMLTEGDAAEKSSGSGGHTGSQILVCTASLALTARSPYALQSATKAGLKFFVDALRIELSGRVRVMSVLPPSVDTGIFAKAGDMRDTASYPPASRVADAMQFMLDLPPDVCVPELLLEQHRFTK